MEDEICINCKADNGVTHKTNCKYCGSPLCKNIWEFKHAVNTTIELSTNLFWKQFDKYSIKEEDLDIELIDSKTNHYRLSCLKTRIDFEELKISFQIKDLEKPIIIKFDDVDEMSLSRHPYFHHYCSLILILTNSTRVKIYRNNVNLELFEVLDKFLETKDTTVTNHNHNNSIKCCS